MKNINELTTLEHWYGAWERSMQEPILVFKHSTSCLISARAFRHVKAFQKIEADKIACYMVKVIESRAVSNEIAKDTNIPHKSPQIFLIHKKQIVWNTSHWTITKHRIKEAVHQLSL